VRRHVPSAFFVVFLAAAHAAQAIELADDRGRVIRLAAPAQRIVTLAPHLAELVHAAGAGAALVGAARFSDFPDGVRLLPQVGDAARVDPERIVELKPDLVLAWRSGNQAGDIERLERLGLRVFVTEPGRLADVPRLLHAVGMLAGAAGLSAQAVNTFDNKIGSLTRNHGHRPPVRVFYEIWHRPLLTVNGRHMISDVLALCGGVNVFANEPLLTPTVSPEAVLAARPEAVVGGSSVTTPQEFAAQWGRHPVAALRNLPVFYVQPDLVQRATPRIADGAQAICDALDAVRVKRDRAKSDAKGVMKGSDGKK
jgi:iron complex transport system substrate-binding protein